MHVLEKGFRFYDRKTFSPFLEFPKFDSRKSWNFGGLKFWELHLGSSEKSLPFFWKSTFSQNVHKSCGIGRTQRVESFPHILCTFWRRVGDFMIEKLLGHFWNFQNLGKIQENPGWRSEILGTPPRIKWKKFDIFLRLYFAPKSAQKLRDR